MNLEDSLYSAVSTVIEHLQRLRPNEIEVPPSRKALAETLSALDLVIMFPIFHKLVNASLLAIIPRHGKGGQLLLNLSRIHVGERNGAVLGARDEMASRVC